MLKIHTILGYDKVCIGLIIFKLEFSACVSRQLRNGGKVIMLSIVIVFPRSV